jgi:transposase
MPKKENDGITDITREIVKELQRTRPERENKSIRERMLDGEFKGMTVKEVCKKYNISKSAFYVAASLLRDSRGTLYKPFRPVWDKIKQAIESGKHKGLMRKELAEKLGVDYGYLTKVIRKLNESGMKVEFISGRGARCGRGLRISENFHSAVKFISGMSESDLKKYCQKDIGEMFNLPLIEVSVAMRTIAVLRSEND